jgi:uncharacterized protein
VKLHAAAPSAANAITGYGDGYVLVNGQRHESSLIVTPEQVMAWDVAAFTELTAQHFEKLNNLKAEIILLGTGPKQRFPQPSLMASVVGLEVMDVKAACRTYNILVAEGRKVAAALMFR